MVIFLRVTKVLVCYMPIPAKPLFGLPLLIQLPLLFCLPNAAIVLPSRMKKSLNFGYTTLRLKKDAPWEANQ